MIKIKESAIFMGMFGLAIHASSAPALPTNNTLYQVSTGNALISGLYQGTVDFGTIRKEGDFGLGSVKDMHGELVAIDGQFYRISPSGKMNIIPDTQTTPYAIVTHFKPESHYSIHNIHNFKELVDNLNKHLPSRNISYAIKITGEYNSLKLRAVRGAKPPYPPFATLVKKQAIFKLKHRTGDAVGFFTPPFMRQVNVPGYHIHFITKNRTIGGHILSCNIKDATVYLMPIKQYKIQLPTTQAFEKSTDINKDYSKLMVSQFGVGVQMK